MPFFDGHNDVLIRLSDDQPQAWLTGHPATHLDLPRARQAGMFGGLFAIYTESQWGQPIDPAAAVAHTDCVIDRLNRMLDHANGSVRLVRNMAELDTCVRADAFAVVLHIEGAEAVTDDLSNLDYWYERGVRSLGLTWSRTNAFAQGVGPGDTGEGLTAAGRDLVRQCNARGIAVDLSHINDAGFQDVADLSQTPLIASHSNARPLCPNERNLTDDQLNAIRDSAGIVGMNFHAAFLRENGTPRSTTVRDIADHACYIGDLIGVDHVGLGSDFDGCDIPADLVDVTGLPRLADALRDRGMSRADLDLFNWKNWHRVLQATWK